MRIAEGLRDLLPEELAFLEEKERSALSLFQAWSYRKVLTTGLEYGECVEPEMTRKGDLYKFFDREGQVLALRPEFTTPIARLVSSRLLPRALDGSMPFRLCYSGDVYRYGSGRYREFRQIGVELIGAAAELADAEVIALSIEMLLCLGLRDFRVSLGHIGVFADLADELVLEEALRKKLEVGLARKDVVGMNSLLASCVLPEKAKELVGLLPSLTGGAEVLERLRAFECFESVRRAAASLRAVYGFLEAFGVQEHVSIDLGILRGFAYYSGTIFEGYIPDVGFPILEGGRYDGLLEGFGQSAPATGFACNLETLLALGGQKPMPKPDAFVYGDSPEKVIRRCQSLRRAGKQVEMAVGPVDASSLLAADYCHDFEFVEPS
ncbi:MAG: ATP phosphoribosyltransferase regulatory subunit [Peptococcaceae bacterium]|nr:ATP phosphoribosyltransferase regulatory subunit [Peptococcaceae bacterium]